VIEGVADADALDDVGVYHARTARRGDDLVTAGPGRILSVTGRGATVAAARERAYAGVTCITLPGAHARTDIAAHVKEGVR
jgi:phosphoribosylamine--glycine ligase